MENMRRIINIQAGKPENIIKTVKGQNMGSIKMNDDEEITVRVIIIRL